MQNQSANTPKLFSEILNHLAGIHFKGTFNGRYSITYLSESSYDVIGYKPEELIGQSASFLSAIVHPDDREMLVKKHNEQAAQGLPFINEFRAVSKKGEFKWLKEITTYEINLETKEMTIEGFVQDITPFKTGVNVVNEYSSYQNAVNSSSIVSITDKSGKIIFANERFCEVSKYSREELLGATHNIVNSGYHPKAFFAKLWEDILAGKIWRGQIRNRSKDGELYWVDTSISPVMSENGEIKQFLSIRNVITEQKEIEYNLRESEALNRSVLASLNASIAILDEHGIVEKINPIWEEITEISDVKDILKAVVGQDFFKILNKAIKEGDEYVLKVKEGINTILSNSKEFVEIEYPSCKQDANKWVLIHISKFENDIKRLVISHFDITTRKLQEEAIRKSESRLLEAQRIAKIGSWDLDIVNNRLFWSDENYRIFEEEKSSESASYQRFLELVHPEDRDFVDRVYKESVRDKKPYNIVHRIQMKDGRIKYVNEQCETFYDNNGNPVRSVGTTQDITQQKESEILLENQRIQYESVVENISDGLIIDDVDGKVVYANKQFMQMIGISEEDLSTFVFDDYVAPEYKDIIRKRHTQRMKGEEVSSIFEYIGLRKDNTKRWFEARVTKIVYGEKIIGTQSAIRDITEEKEGIDLLKASEAEKTNLLQELNQRYNELMQFNYIVSHNLRAPIANIIGLADMFNMSGIDEEEKQQIISHIQYSILKIDELINDLNVILAARSDINSKKERIVFSDIMQRVEKTLAKQIRDSKAHIDIVIDDDAKEIYSIKSFIKSSVYNLVNNAIKYRSNHKAPLIRVHFSRIGNFIEISVKDNGIGIDMEKHGKDIFGLYKRFHTSFEGKGLGLNMTKTQVESLGGSIQIQSKPGEGSTFIILLPDRGNETKKTAKK